MNDTGNNHRALSTPDKRAAEQVAIARMWIVVAAQTLRAVADALERVWLVDLAGELRRLAATINEAQIEIGDALKAPALRTDEPFGPEVKR